MSTDITHYRNIDSSINLKNSDFHKIDVKFIYIIDEVKFSIRFKFYTSQKHLIKIDETNMEFFEIEFKNIYFSSYINTSDILHKKYHNDSSINEFSFPTN